MKGIIVTAGNEVTVKDFGAPLFMTLGEAVDGSIELVYPRGLAAPFCMVVNEEGLLRGFGINRVGSYFYETHKHGSPIVGDVVFMKTDMTEESPDIVGLNEEDIDFLWKNIYPFIAVLKRSKK